MQIEIIVPSLIPRQSPLPLRQYGHGMRLDSGNHAQTKPRLAPSLDMCRHETIPLTFPASSKPPVSIPLCICMARDLFQNYRARATQLRDVT